jgi:hypothetical protein
MRSSALAGQVTINFPWGSLLRALLVGDDRVLGRLRGRDCTIRVNAGAMAEAGFGFDDGVQAVITALRRTNPHSLRWQVIGREELRRVPTTWAKRLAFGRDPRAVVVEV